jgi:large repetitive protein
MHAPRTGHSATGLPDGKVLIAGGLNDYTNTVLDSAELYDPTKVTFTVAAKMMVGRFEHTASALPDGKVLIAGGFEDASTITYTAELYNPLQAVFTPTGNMTYSRAEAAAAFFVISVSGDVPRRNQPVTNLAPMEKPPPE